MWEAASTDKEVQPFSTEWKHASVLLPPSRTESKVVPDGNIKAFYNA